MERSDRPEVESSRFAAGTSPTRGYLITGAALLLGLFVMLLAFDGRNEGISAEGSAVSAPETNSAQDEAVAEGPTSTVTPGGESQEIDGSDAAEPGNPEDILPPAAAETEVPGTQAMPSLRSPEELTIMVVNSKAGKGAAARLTQKLEGQGYNSAAPANASQTAASAVYYVDGFGAEAKELAGALGVGTELALPLDSTSELVDDRENATIFVVLTSAGPIRG